ncbi:hypothetical protein Tco_0758932 [Tanacetum coccineum]
MASESSTTTHVTPAPNVAFECEKGSIAFNNGIILRSKSKKTVIGTHHAQEPVAIADTTQRESGEDKGYPRPNRESESARSYLISSVHSESSPGSDTLSHALRVHELHSASGVTELQIKKNPELLTFKGNQSSPSIFLEQRTGDPSLHYKFTCSTNHFMQEHETKATKNVMEEQMDTNAEITFMGAIALDQIIEEAESDVEYMPNDEILSILGDDEEEFGDSDNEFSIPN